MMADVNNTLQAEFARWVQFNKFKIAARGNLRGKLLYEMDNILARLMLGLYNHPDMRAEVIKKAKSELKEKRIYRELPVVLLEKVGFASVDKRIEVERNEVEPRISIDKYPSNCISVVAVGNCTFKFQLSVELYDKLIVAGECELIKMLLRYDTIMCQTGQFWGMPARTWRLLIDKYGAEYEGFACPLNSNLPKFFSLFPSDAVFGGQENFFDADLQPGVYVANPPYVESIMEKLTIVVQEMMTNSSPTTFFMLLPNWRDNKYLMSMITAKECRADITLKRGHRIRDYVGNKNITANFENIILVLSNVPLDVDCSELKRTFE